MSAHASAVDREKTRDVERGRRVACTSVLIAGTAEIEDGLLTQREAAAVLHVSARYLRDSACPKLLLPGSGSHGRAVVRYVRAEVLYWALSCRGRR
jgi:hypothetical protein